ncbi:hypothetical protein [Marmoricola sp. RAF53]|uniref:hypothetical protein n=1 Tax=Marmoricola sp. RAF53 TaxID=3233059 RepID=UPI003F9994E7
MAKPVARETKAHRVPAPRLPGLDDDQITRLLALLPDVDAVELKVTVPDSDRRPVLAALGVDPLDAEIRQVAFIDTPDLAVLAAGVVIRARRTQHRAADVVVKLRPVAPESVTEELRADDGFGLELDVSPRGLSCGATLQAEVPDRRLRELLSGRLPVTEILSAGQRALLADRIPELLARDDLAVHGPIHVLKRKFLPTGLDLRLVAELWFLPDGSRIFELSTKCKPSAAFQVAAETKHFLATNGVDLNAEQDTKTRTALVALTAGSESP